MVQPSQQKHSCKELLNWKPQSVYQEFHRHVTEFIEAHDASCILYQNYAAKKVKFRSYGRGN